MNVTEGKAYFKHEETRQKVVSSWREHCNDSQNEEEILKWVTQPPLSTVVRVNTLLLSREKLAEKLRAKLKTEFCTRGYKPPDVVPHKLLHDVLIVESQRDACYLPEVKNKYVIVDVRCGEAVLRGAHVYAPGVLSVNGEVGEMVSVYVDVLGECLRGHRKPFNGLLKFVGNGVLLRSRISLFCESKLDGVGVRMDDPLVDHPSLHNLLPEFCFPQNFPSIVVGHILNPNAGDAVLDLCAGVGGKSTHIAQLMGNEGTVVCIDKNKSKLRTLEVKAKKMDIKVILPFHWNSANIVNKTTSSIKSLEPPFFVELFDSVLADVPCSGLGLRPTLYIKDSVTKLKDCVRLQRHICSQAVQLVKPGGVLIYSTCTILPEENELQVQWILSNYPEFKLESPGINVGFPGLDYGLSFADRGRVLRFGRPAPTRSCDDDTIGFFVAKFRKDR